MDFEKAYSYVTEKLEQDLPEHLRYHNADHTREVVQYAAHLAEMEQVADEQLKILKTAALFHDVGFLRGYKDHEDLSCQIAKEWLPTFDYTEDQIECVCVLIQATRLPQDPSHQRLKNILCDADLYYLGTDSYFLNADRLFHELKEEGLIKSRQQWHQQQVQFLESHHYFTDTATRECERNKQRNLQLLHAARGGKRRSKKTDDVITTAEDVFLIFLGILCAGFALKGFMVPNNFIDGGITGISLLLHEIYHVNLSITIVILNLPIIISSFFLVSRSFSVKTFFCVLALGILLLFFPYPVITSDKLLISIFGGAFMGIGVGLIMRAGGALDGIEILALYTLKRTSFTITEIILAINIVIFGVAAFSFGVETALYSILTYFSATRTVDYVVEGIEAYTGVTIISGNSEMIKHRLVNELGRGITVYKGERGFLPDSFEVSADCDIIFTVITRLELRRLKNMVYSSDPKAFVFASTIKEASGGIIKKRHGH